MINGEFPDGRPIRPRELCANHRQRGPDAVNERDTIIIIRRLYLVHDVCGGERRGAERFYGNGTLLVQKLLKRDNEVDGHRFA